MSPCLVVVVVPDNALLERNEITLSEDNSNSF